MKKLAALTVIAVTGISLAGCSLGPKSAVEPQTPPSKTQTGSERAPKPLTKKIEVFVEGQKEMREARLAASKALGYQIYVLKGFRLESEEPGKDVLISDYDGDFFARIEKLSGNTNLDEYKDQQTAGYKQLGKVTERDPKTLFHQTFRDAKFTLLTEIGYEEGRNQTSINYLVKDFDGQLFALTLHMPLKEAAEGITPSLWAMLSTLEPQ